MGCHHSGNLVLCAPSLTYRARRVRHCPFCDRRRRFVVTQHGVWYSPVWTCCGCGDSWTEGFLNERPFKPRWRDEAIRKAKEQWAAGPVDRMDEGSG